MTLWPRSLFGRLILLLVAVVGLVALTTFLLFNRDRAALGLQHAGRQHKRQKQRGQTHDNRCESNPPPGRPAHTNPPQIVPTS